MTVQVLPQHVFLTQWNLMVSWGEVRPQKERIIQLDKTFPALKTQTSH
jgi:hypothetical protein